MKGLLIKDIRLMKNMKNSLLLILVIAAGMSAYLSNASFLVIYLGMLGTSFTSSTLSYDEFDNGYAFLFSLPVTRRAYVVEKYGFGMLMCLGGWLLGTVLAVVSSVVKGGQTSVDLVMEALIMFPVVLLLLSVQLPFHMKFGAEKGKMVIVCFGGGLFVLLVVAAKILDKLNLNPEVPWESISTLGMGAVVAGAVIVGIMVTLLSCRISISIMEGKEF